MAFKQFKLPCENFNSIFSKDELDRSVVVVSIIGRTTLDHITSKSVKIPNFIDNIETLLENIGGKDASSDVCQFEGYYDKDESVVYLALVGPMNVDHLISTLKTLKEELEQTGFLNSWSKVKNSYARALLLMFSFSHLILLSSPGFSVNINIIQLLKVLSYVRPKYQAGVIKALGKCRGLSEDWIFHGRLCSPRLIFLFKGCPYEISVEKDKEEQISRIKKLEHSLEDQIYMALRKSRLVKNVCSRAFFSIAPNDEFVFVNVDDKRDLSKDVMLQESLEKHLKIKQASKMASSLGSSSYSPNLFSPSESSYPLCTFNISEISDNSPYSSENEGSETEEPLERLEGSQLPCHSFKDFLMKHVRKAHNEGFSDNMGKYSNVKPFFEVPSLRNWLSSANMIMIEAESGIKELNSTSNQLEKLLGTELKYSTARCKKVLPLALAIYQDNLPSHYNQLTHEKKVKQAVAIFSHHARGPAQQKFVDQLKEECEKIWKSGRQTCEALSLNKNPCTKPKHQTSSTGHPQLGESEHWSGVQFYSSCNCGAKQGPRQDPFTLRSANYDFYQIIGQECGCSHLEKFVFSVFQPSISDYREADLSNPNSHSDNISSNIQEVQSELHDMHLCSQSLSTGKLWNIQESVHDCEGAMSLPLSNLCFDQSNNLGMNYITSSQHEKHLVRQASTTEYLPGMIHLESPLGFLPQFPSWSLLCRGPSSLYSHNLGLHDYPGFIPGSSYLLPWDVSFREKDMYKNEAEVLKKSASNTSVQILKPGNRRNQRSTKEFVSVKIFIGIEYECLRGHRFMSSAPGVVLKATGTSVKEDAHKITEGNMPLFLPCPCGKVIAQLMRVHIVTPKAPVYVTIDPKIRPAPSPCPTFITGEQKPIPLSQSAYWVLRLPYVYASERKIYGIPTRMRNLKYGELLGPMYGITQDPDN